MCTTSSLRVCLPLRGWWFLLFIARGRCRTRRESGDAHGLGYPLGCRPRADSRADSLFPFPVGPLNPVRRLYLKAMEIRNIAIIAHVDHGKTTLVDKMLRQ